MNRAHRRARRSDRPGKARAGVTLFAAMSVAALAGLSLVSAGGFAQDFFLGPIP
jgi:hypothetical protein